MTSNPELENSFGRERISSSGSCGKNFIVEDENAKAGAMEILDHYLDTSTEDNEEFTGVTTVLSFLMAEISYIC